MHVARWDKKDTYGQRGHSWSTTSPEDQTAYHLVKELPAQADDVRVAYKLEAYCRAHELNSFLHNVVHPVYVKHDLQHPYWWHSNAKHVIPSDPGTYWPLGKLEAEQAKQWTTIVIRAAEAWRKLASEWIVIRVPDLMDNDTDEYQAFLVRARTEHEARERREYERLRAHFETPSPTSPPAI
jgi:hypothetical protein